MQKNVLIGIGGTGSRVIESVVHLCAAGLGPERLHIFMIDPDQGNGNLTRTKQLIKKYTELRALYQRVPKDGESNPCFKTDIVIPPGDESFVWGIFDEKDYTLGKYINYDNLKKADQQTANLADFANVLFTKKELETSLDKGFRGHPSIGAVVMADPPMEEYPFKLLWDDVATLHANELQVFLVGSIFGGTGAAGFPTLGSRQLIKFNEKMQARIAGEKSKVLLGGALVLPYFSFSIDANSPESMFVTPNDFPIATKAALQYYNDKALGFDQYYFIGDSLSQKVGDFSTGSSTQDNLPHYIEMISALASFDFFTQPAVEDIPEKKYFIACRENDKLNWDTLPVTRNSSALQQKRKELKDKLAVFTTFAYAYLTFGKDTLERSHRDAREEAWYGDNFNRDFKEENVLFNPRHEDSKVLYNKMDEYLHDFLFWICALDDSDKVELVDSSKIINGEAENHKQKLNFKNPTQFVANIGEVLKDRTNKKDFNFFKKYGLEESVIKDNITAANKFLNIFYHAAVKFNKLNGAIN